MDATTMQSTASLIKKLRLDYPNFSFTESDRYSWSPTLGSIQYIDDDNFEQLLHELSHGILGHSDYSRDIELLGMERDAWDKAQSISDRYKIKIDKKIIESNLDSYREWLHSRSLCPKCNANGSQVSRDAYECPACSNRWRVNDARICSLRRFNIK